MTNQYLRPTPYSNPAHAELDAWKDDPTAEEKLDAIPDSALSREDLNWKKRQGDGQRHITTLQGEISELKAEREQLQQQLNTPKRSENLVQMHKDHPDLVNVITEAAREELAGVKSQMAEIRSERDTANLDARRSAATAMLLVNHSDAASIVKSDAWYNWVESLPESVQKEIGDKAQYDGNLITYHVGNFKAVTGYDKKVSPSQRRQNNDSAAHSVNHNQSADPDHMNKGPKAYSEAEILKMPDAEFDKHEEAIMAYQRTTGGS